MPIALTPERILTIQMVLDAIIIAAERNAERHVKLSPAWWEWQTFADELRAIRNGEKGVEGA